MAAANYSRDVLEMYAPTNRQKSDKFVIVKNQFNGSMNEWKMQVTKNNKDLFRFFQNTKESFVNVCEREVEAMKSIKIKISLNARFYIYRNEERQEMNHYFNRMEPVIVNKHNKDIIMPLINQFIDQVNGDIAAWSERGSGWILDKITEAYIKVARYQPMRGGSYMPLPKKLKNKKAIINVQNKDNQCSRWAIRAALFPAPRGRKVSRPSSYPEEDGLNFAGIDFPTPVSQFGRLERQNPNLAINVFGWEGGNVVVHRISERGGEIPRINLMLTTQGENSHYSFVKRLSALLYDQTKHNESKHFCERCLHCYRTIDRLERHKPECQGLLKIPTRTEMPKEGENKMALRNYHKQMKVPYVVYADFECLVKKIATCEPDAKNSFTVKTEKNEPCGFSYAIVRSDGQSFGPYTYRGEDAVYKFLMSLLMHEVKMREDMTNKRPQAMAKEDWQNYRKATECYICNKSLFKDNFLDSMEVYDPENGKYCGQSHRRCFHKAAKGRYAPREIRKPKDFIDKWIEITQK